MSNHWKNLAKKFQSLETTEQSEPFMNQEAQNPSGKEEASEAASLPISKIAKAGLYLSYSVTAACLAMCITPADSGTDWFPFLTERFILYFAVGFCGTILTLLLSIIAMIRIKCSNGRFSGYRQSLAALGVLILSIGLWILSMWIKLA